MLSTWRNVLGGWGRGVGGHTECTNAFWYSVTAFSQSAREIYILSKQFRWETACNVWLRLNGIHAGKISFIGKLNKVGRIKKKIDTVFFSSLKLKIFSERDKKVYPMRFFFSFPLPHADSNISRNKNVCVFSNSSFSISVLFKKKNFTYKYIYPHPISLHVNRFCFPVCGAKSGFVGAKGEPCITMNFKSWYFRPHIFDDIHWRPRRVYIPGMFRKVGSYSVFQKYCCRLMRSDLVAQITSKT